MSIRTALVARLGLVLLLCACRGPESSGPRSKLTLSGTPPEAAVLVDEQPIGTLAMVQKLGVALPPGQHRLTVQADGYFPADLLVDVDARGGVIRRAVRLTALPEP